jgi:pyridoxal phosphate enzyme (YggS family)
MNAAEIRSRLRDNLHAVESRIAAACARVGRDPREIMLVAVTKYVDVDVAELLLDLGVRNLGESRPQELWRKAAAINTQVNWHLIGHLQRNKVERTVPLVACIHSVDSERLLEALVPEAAKLSYRLDVLLEVNLSREPNKHGFAPDDLPKMRRELLHPYTRVYPLGLMTMAMEANETEACRSTFAELRELRNAIQSGPNRFASPMVDLSMGMTNDFEVAIEEGATMVRIGSALFEGIVNK